MRRRAPFATYAIVGLISAFVSVPPFDFLRGWSSDITFWLRNAAFGQQHSTGSSPAVVIALDEETYRTPPFAERPVVLWTPQIAAVLDAVIGGGAKVVGFDIILPQSVESVARGYDREFLLSLRNAARQSKVVLGKLQHELLPIKPFPGQSFAVGHQQNIRSNNLFRDDDEVVRRAPLTFRSDELGGGERTETSMALELVSRALGIRHEPSPNGGLMLRGNRIPGSEKNNLTLNFDAGIRTIPTLSFADLYACAQKADRNYFRQQFDGKIVLIGTVLDVEDRKLTSARYVTSPEGILNVPRCVHPQMQGVHRGDVVRETIPGVMVHATAVNNLVRGNALREFDRPLIWGINAFVSLGAAVLATAYAPVVAATAIVGGALAWAASATVALQLGYVLPLLDSLIGAAMTFTLVLGYRFIVADRDKRLLRQSFSLYLAPSVVDQLVEGETPPVLGGETREVTIWFSDIQGFTAISTTLQPADLVSLMNEYLTAMTDIVEAHSGFVDKYIGDAIVAVFGAPLDDADHALHAVSAALACQAKLKEMNDMPSAFQGHRLLSRIGINTGRALVGNIGSRKRFNYTVMGDAVNIASRLEGVNKHYGTYVLASDATAAATGNAIAWREIDRVRVVGRSESIAILEPLPAQVALDPVAGDQRQAYARALAAFRDGRFDEAAEMFAITAEHDPPARSMLVKAREYAQSGSPPGWDGVTTLDVK